MVVEDDQGLREQYRAALTLAGYVVVSFVDGIDALRAIDAGVRAAAVVLDLGLPRLSGMDVSRELRAHERTAAIPVVIVTGSGMRLSDSDYACVLRKPVDPAALVEAVERCLRKAS